MRPPRLPPGWARLEPQQRQEPELRQEPALRGPVPVWCDRGPVRPERVRDVEEREPGAEVRGPEQDAEVRGPEQALPLRPA